MAHQLTVISTLENSLGFVTKYLKLHKIGVVFFQAAEKLLISLGALEEPKNQKTLDAKKRGELSQ